MKTSLRFRFADFLTGGELGRMRSWLFGQGAGSFDGSRSGHDNSEFSPAEYGEYIATSNAVYTCVSMRASFLARLKLRLYQDQNSLQSEVTSGKLYELLRKVNPFWTQHRLMRMTSYALDLWGANFWVLERGQSGKQPPAEIWWGRPDCFQVVPHDTNYLEGFLYTPPEGGDPIFFLPQEVIWIVNPNPLDEFNGLSPLAAARLAADTASAGMHSNLRNFDQGMLAAGLVFPPDDVDQLSVEQARELEKAIDARISGRDREHRLAVMRYKFRLEQTKLTPKDAEWLGALKWSLEDVCRAYHWPLDLVGGQRTYENLAAALKAAWINAVLPQADFIASELTEQLLPMFDGQADSAAFDSSHIEVLQKDRKEVVDQIKTLFDTGVPLNELLDEFMPSLLPESGAYPWGDIGWAPGIPTPYLAPKQEDPTTGSEGSGDGPGLSEAMVLNGAQIQSALSIVQYYADGLLPRENAIAMMVAFFNIPEDVAEGLVPDSPGVPAEEERAYLRMKRAVEYGSQEHERLWRRFERRADRWEKKFRQVLADLFRRQRDSILDRLKARSRNVEDAIQEPFDLAQWIKTFRAGIIAAIAGVVDDVGSGEFDELDLAKTFSVEAPLVAQFIERQAQRFATEVNQTTWDAIVESLKEGLQLGESLPAVQKRLEDLFETWLGSDPALADKLSRIEMIARTEVLRAYSGGQLQAWQQSGVVESKSWLAALDQRTRDSHIEAHGQYQAEPIGLQEDFTVGGCVGPGPGLMGCAEEDINCRCTMQPVVSERYFKMVRLVRANGHHKENGYEKLPAGVL